eukprot:50671_1
MGALCFVVQCILIITPSVAQICETADSCSNTIINASNIAINGYKSGSNSTINVTNEVRCDGSLSCSQSLISSIDILLMGVLSGYEASLMSDNRIECDGSNSCISTTITSGQELYCNSEVSCSYSNISGIELINGFGAFSLTNAIIRSTNINGNNLNIFFYGYKSGNGAQIHCESSHSCDIHCMGNSCDKIECHGNGCNINYEKTTSATLINPYNALNTATNNQLRCNDNNAWSLDDAHNQYVHGWMSIDSNVTSLCCRGDQSCSGGYNIGNVNIDYSGEIVCGGFDSCSYLKKINNYEHNIFCEGYGACYQSEIYTDGSDGTVHCSGSHSCENTKITANNVICSGTNSCCWSDIISHGYGGDVFFQFIGSISRNMVNVHCKENDVCYIFMIPDPDHDGISFQCDGKCIIYECPGGCEIRDCIGKCWDDYTQVYTLMCSTADLNISIYSVDITEEYVVETLEQT